MLKFSSIPDKKVTVCNIICMALIVIFGFAVTRSSDVGKESCHDSFVPDKNSGFIDKTNKFLEYLLDVEADNSVIVHSIADLNRKYPALEFAIPFDELGELTTSFMHTSDIRLMDINIDRVKDEEWLKFYYNSSIQSILDKQRNNQDLNFFEISFLKDDGGNLSVRHIELIPSLFRQSLGKNLWKGTIMASDGYLFPKNDFCFLSFGTNVLPIKHSVAKAGVDGYGISAWLDERVFVKGAKPLKLVDISRDYENGEYPQVVIQINQNSSDETRIGTLNLKYLKNEKIELKTDKNLVCEANVEGRGQELVMPSPSTSIGNTKVIDFSNDIKLIFYKNENPMTKCAEMVLSHDNPMLLLSGVTRSNSGESRYTIDRNLTDRFTQQVIRGVSGMLTDLNVEDTAKITINPFFSKWLEDEMKRYVDNLRKQFRANNIGKKNDRWEMSVTVVDMATGNVIAMPYYRSDDEKIPYAVALTRKNPALIKRYIGSTFKPLLALSCVLTDPELINLNTVTNRIYQKNYPGKNDNDSIAMMLNNPIKRWAHNQWEGRTGIADFLAKSCDVYPVAMTLLALDPAHGLQLGNKIFFANNRNDNLRYHAENEDLYHWNNMPLFDTMARIFDVNSYTAEEGTENSTMSRYLWRNLYPSWNSLSDDSTRSVELVSPDVTVMRYDAFNKDPYSVRGNIVPWILGQGSNEWSAIKLAEAWCRMLTRRNVKVSMVYPTEHKYPESIPSNVSIWNQFLSEMLNAQANSPSLLTPMNNTLARLNANLGRHDNGELLLFSKTGTPDNYSRQEFLNVKNASLQYDMGLFCMGIMTRGSYNLIREGKQGGGVVCVVRLTRISERRQDANGLDSKYARNFFSGSLNRLENFYWFCRPYFW